MADKTMNVSVLVTIDGDSKTSNEFKIANAPMKVVVELERLLIDSITKFMAAHQQ